MRLREAKLFKKEDIRRYRLVLKLRNQKVFAFRRFEFLVEWDPSSLLQSDRYEGTLPLHWVSFEPFRSIFDAGIRYFPNKKGIHLLFRKDNCGNTPFQDACTSFKRKEVIDVIVDALARYSNFGTPLNLSESLFVGAIDENIHLDG